MGSHRWSESSRRRRNRSDDSVSNSPSSSESDSPPRSHSHRRRRRRSPSAPDASDDGSDRERRRRRPSSKKITDEDISEYLAKKAQKKALLIVGDWELAEARKKDALDRARVRGEHPPAELLAEGRGLHSSIESDVKKLLGGKSYGDLVVLQSKIESQMRSGTAKVVEYWEAVLKRLHIYKAKACLKEIHTKMLRKYLEQLEQPLKVEDAVVLEQKLVTKKEEENYDEKVNYQSYILRTIKEEEEEITMKEVIELFHPSLCWLSQNMKWKKTMGRIHHSCCMVMMMEKQLTQNMTRLFWKENVKLFWKNNKG